ncbi:hypothetical protein P7C73_g5539, partial [Tremellales sp. Uapishka_1]
MLENHLPDVTLLQEDERTARQAKLQKALSTAYLTHQITELETRVQGMNVDEPVTRGRSGSFEDEGPPEKEDDEWRVVVVDVSALLWAPKEVKRLVGKGWEVVIPLEGAGPLKTLDLLKKGSSAMAIAARSGARYIEHSSRHYRLLSQDPSLTVQLSTGYKRGRGLRLQRDEEVGILDDGLANQIPKWIISMLECSTFFQKILNAEGHGEDDEEWDEVKPVLYVSHPPLSIETNAVPVTYLDGVDRSDGPNVYSERGEGYLISAEAERWELGLGVLRDDEEGVIGNPRQNGFERGRGRGGSKGGRVRSKGRGGKKESAEPERIVKVLLRRPPSDAEAPAESMPPPPLQSKVKNGSPVIPSPIPHPQTTPAYPRPPAEAFRGAGRRGRGGGGGGAGRGGKAKEASFTLLQRPGPSLASRLDGPLDTRPDGTATPHSATQPRTQGYPNHQLAGSAGEPYLLQAQGDRKVTLLQRPR